LLIEVVMISRLLRNVVNHPTSINLAFISTPICKRYGVGMKAELAKWENLCDDRANLSMAWEPIDGLTTGFPNRQCIGHPASRAVLKQIGTGFGTFIGADTKVTARFFAVGRFASWGGIGWWRCR
jgi:hypothetical protein